MRLLPFAVCAVIVLIGGGVSAHSYQQGDIHIGHIWARATPPGATTAAVYVPLLNMGTEQDKLISASTSIAKKVEIHQDVTDNGIMKMRKLDAVTLEPNKSVSLQPNGIHLMVFGLTQQLKEGEMFPMTLQFEKAGTIQVKVKIEAIGAMSGKDMPAGAMPEGSMSGSH